MKSVRAMLKRRRNFLKARLLWVIPRRLRPRNKERKPRSISKCRITTSRGMR
jgi:hypothetical protein